MDTEKLITRLTDDLKPVQPVWSPARTSSAMIVLSFVFVTFAALATHFRSDLWPKLSEVSYSVDLLFPALIMMYAFIWAARISIPGVSSGRVLPKFAISLFGIYLAIEILRCMGMDSNTLHGGLDPVGAKCLAMVLVFSCVPIAVLTYWTRKRAPMKRGWTGALIAIAGVAAGWFGIALHCPSDNALHLALWHFALPMIYGVGLGVAVLSRLLRW